MHLQEAAEAQPADTAGEPRAKRTRRAADTDAAAAKDNSNSEAGGEGKSKAKAAGKATPKATVDATKAKPVKGKTKAGGGDGASSAGDGGDGGGKSYYLMKSEPEEFSLDDLEAKPDSTGHWEGERWGPGRRTTCSCSVGGVRPTLRM